MLQEKQKGMIFAETGLKLWLRNVFRLKFLSFSDFWGV
jgi:hypothetical protein